MKLSTIILLATTAMTPLQAMQITPSPKFIPQENPSWVSPFEFRVSCKNAATNEISNVSFKCIDKSPVSFILANGDNFPKLDLKNQPSCNAFYQSLQNYVSGLKVMRREYHYEAILGENRLTCLKTPPNQIPLNCTLDAIHLQANYGLKRLEIGLFLLKIGEGDNSVIIDATSKFRDRFGPVPLTPFKSEGQSNLEQIVSTRADLNDCIFDAVGSIDTFQIPVIPGIHGFETPQEKRIITYSKGATFYEDALASRIITPQTNEWVIQISNANDTEDYSAVSSSRTGASWQENSMEGDRGVFELHKHFKLIAHEQRATSPYIYFDGKSWYLTQTFEQNCIPLVNGHADLTAIHILRYTLPTLYPVQVNGFATTKPKGLYLLSAEEGSWMLVNNFYEPQDMFPAQRMGSHGILTTTAMSQPQTCDLKCTLENLGAAGDYVELMGSAKFQELLTRFTRNTSGLLRSIEALPSHEEHIIPRLLLMVRDFKHLQDNDLMHSGSTGTSWFKTPTTGWGYSDHEQHYSNLRNKLGIPDFFYQVLKSQHMVTFYIQTPGSMKLLPLIPGFDPSGDKRERVQILICDYDGQSGKYRPFEGGSVPIYQALANYLSTDDVDKFIFTRNYEHESDNELTIQPFARVIRHLKNLKKITIPRYIGIKNLEYLIDHGLAYNHSITDIEFGQIYGEYPVALMGRLLAKNTTLKKLYVSMENVTDLECLNELGRGLQKNKTLEELTLKIKTDNEFSNVKSQRPDWILNTGDCNSSYTPIRPLPGRPRGSLTTNFDVFGRALMDSNLNYFVIGGYKGCEGRNLVVVPFVNMIEGINKQGLKKHIY